MNIAEDYQTPTTCSWIYHSCVDIAEPLSSHSGCKSLQSHLLVHLLVLHNNATTLHSLRYSLRECPFSERIRARRQTNICMQKSAFHESISPISPSIPSSKISGCMLSSPAMRCTVLPPPHHPAHCPLWTTQSDCYFAAVPQPGPCHLQDQGSCRSGLG